MIEVRHDVAAHRFTAEIEGQSAVLEYEISGDIMAITHTRVPKAIGGRGIAGELMRAALGAARVARWKVVPVCSYAAAYVAKHPEDGTDAEVRAEVDAKRHQDELLDEALEETFPASDPPAVGGGS